MTEMLIIWGVVKVAVGMSHIINHEYFNVWSVGCLVLTRKIGTVVSPGSKEVKLTLAVIVWHHC